MAKNKKKKSLTLILRNYFITGVVVLIPIGFTLYLTKFIIGISSKIIPQNINPNNYLPYAIPGIEIINFCNFYNNCWRFIFIFSWKKNFKTY